MADNKKRLGFLPGWRKGTYIILAFNLLMLIWVVGGASTASGTPTDCGTLSASLCNDAETVGAGIAVALLMTLWVFGDIILGVIWLVTNNRGRQCPACGTNVKKGRTMCRPCGHDFAAALHLQHA